MYKIIGSDQKEYGPVSADQIRQWIAEGRLGGHSRIQAEGMADWLPLSSFAEFADALAAGPAATAPTPRTFAAPAPDPLPTDFGNRDDGLDLGGCFSNGWTLFKENFGVLLGGVLIFMAIEGAIGLLGAIPFIGPLFSIANILVVGPLMGGLFYLFLQALRRQPTNVGDVFAGFRLAWAQLFLGQLVSGLLAGLCMIPAVVVAFVTIFMPVVIQHRQPGTAQILIVVIVALVCLIPTIYLRVNWMFTLPLIIDKRMDFWPAMQASWKRVSRYWWQAFALVFIAGLLNVIGMLCCCVGVLFTMPVGFGAVMYAYETLFRETGAPAR